MSLTLAGATERIYSTGDSTDDVAFGFQGWKQLRMQYTSKFDARYWVDTSQTGWKAADVAGVIVADIAKHRPTIVLCRIGLNDAISGTAQGPFQTSINTICNTGVRTYLVGPLCVFEKTDGSNVLDNAIVQVDGWMSSVASGYSNVLFRSVRRSVFNVVEPIQNVPAPGIAIGPLTRPDTAGDHQNPNGRNLLTQTYLQDLVF